MQPYVSRTTATVNIETILIHANTMMMLAVAVAAKARENNNKV